MKRVLQDKNALFQDFVLQSSLSWVAIGFTFHLSTSHALASKYYCEIPLSLDCCQAFQDLSGLGSCWRKGIGNDQYSDGQE